ncbi:phosphatidate cytidylyltransferase [Sporosarcina oncorhynchi]|uniref:Phosphatidate cytidylyltransferase n=1 Tax=Sporosarcina oncorhynchi TaxID=3056444 RepID=A0ABZ0L3K3_9BACL|nr:phosphatidate cytidylyltransferase [Sporosarcina sp. T2O-4]WOV86750.1 phosphatidate cytidylyltransferase [Sporosarcina sp. T2O-4]
MSNGIFSTEIGIVLAGILGLLIVSSIIAFILTISKKEKDFTELNARIKSWWVMAAVFLLAILVNHTVSLFFLAFLCYLALKEYLSLIPTNRAHRKILFWAYLAIPIQFYWIYIGWYGMFIVFIPVYLFLFLPIQMILIGENKGFLRTMGSVHWGLMIMVFGLSHLAYLLVLPGTAKLGGAGLVLFVVILTQCNDVAQFIWGKLLGRHKVIPKVSPNKTWEGLLGGVATTVLLSYLLAPLLTPLTVGSALFAGLLIGLTGFIGDVNISSLKRDLNIKDTGSAIPGHGGILDRVDSLTYTAPLFFHFIRYFYFT